LNPDFASSRKIGLSIIREATRKLSEILDLTVLVPNDHRIPRIDYRYVKRTDVFALEQKLCLILRDLPDCGTLVKLWAIAVGDRYRHLRAVNETDQEFRAIE
jgi:hypothetical protein